MNILPNRTEIIANLEGVKHESDFFLVRYLIYFKGPCQWFLYV